MKPFFAGGLSLLELLIVLLLLSGLTAWAGLRVEQIVSKQLLRRTSTVLDGLFEHHALAAISKRTPFYLIFDQAAGTVSRTRSAPGMQNEGSPPELIYALPRGIRFRELRLPRLKYQQQHLEFSADGTATPGTIVLAAAASGPACSIVQALGGRRSVQCDES